MGQELDHDTQLMVQVSKGDLRAFEELVEKHKASVINAVYKMINDLIEAEDIAQNVFIQIYKAAPRYQPSAKFTTWMFTIVRNLSLNEIRRRSIHKLDSLEGSQLPDDSERAEPQFADPKTKNSIQVAEQNELERAIDEAMASLPENQRTALVLRRYEDMPYEEIAKIINCSVPATKSIIFRARETMKEKLRGFLEP